MRHTCFSLVTVVQSCSRPICFTVREQSDSLVGKLFSDVTSFFAKSGTWYTPTSLIWNGGPKYWAEQEFSETSSENRDISFASDKEEYKNKAMEYLAYVNQQESKGIPPPPEIGRAHV